MAAAFLLCVWAVGLAGVSADWTTKNSIPSVVADWMSASVVASSFVLVSDNTAHVLDLLADTWTTVDPMPTDRRMQSSAPVASTAIFISGLVPGSPTTTTTTKAVEAFDPSTGAWVSKSLVPTGRYRTSAATDSEFVFFLSGQIMGYGDRLEIYVIETDVWKTGAATPIGSTGVGCGVAAGKLVALGGATETGTHVYDTVADTWTTATTIPTPRGRLYDMVEGIGDYLFLCGTEPYSPITERYFLLADTWTTVASNPLTPGRGATAMTSGGIFVVARAAGSLDVHTFATGFSAPAAGVVGDPAFTTFLGRHFDLFLRPGLFRLLDTPTTTVNILVDKIATLPPEENHGIVMVGIVVRENHSVILVIMQHRSFGLSPSSGWLDVIVAPLSPWHEWEGLLVDLDRWPATKSSVDFYEVPSNDGCLFYSRSNLRLCD